jgi:hypothetical protein
MSLPRKQNRDEDERRVLYMPTRQSVQGEKVGLRNRGTADVAKFSRLSAQMVELSLQQTQREPTLHDTFPAEVSAAKPKAVSPPLPLPSTVAAPLHLPQPQEAPRESKIPNYWKEVGCHLDNWLAGARVSGSAAVQNLWEQAKSAQRKFAVSNLKSRDGTASRLWTSTGMAALSAVLAVGVISGVRHYAYTPDAPEHGNKSPVIPAMQNISQPGRSSIVDSDRAAALQHPARSSAAKHAPAEQAAAKHAPVESGIRKIRRRNRDDDYVAKDTYVYYGPKGKPAR